MARKKTPARRAATGGSRRLVALAREAGATAAQVVDPATVETPAWVRWKCRFGCSGYGSSLVCPPHTPTPDETRALLDGYGRAVLFEAPGGQVKAVAAALERTLFLAGFHKALGLGAGPCMLCKRCALDEGCRHAEQARPAMEAVGIDVFATVRKHGWELEVVRDGADPQHYYGLVLVD